MYDVVAQVMQWFLSAATLGAAAGYFGKILRKPLELISLYRACRLCGLSKEEARQHVLGKQMGGDDDAGLPQG